MVARGIRASTLHEQASKSFRRTSNGLIFSEDLKAVYSVFLIDLNLKDVDKDTKKGFFRFQPSVYPFSFSIQEAVETMNHLELLVDTSVTCISISYTIQPEMAYYLLEVFMAAKLLHTPADRTRSSPKDKVLLQPTPKGVAILQKYVRDIGLKKIPEILTSDFSSMELFNFERSLESDAIIHSDYLIHILFIRMMGISPNIWSPSNPVDKIPSLSRLLEYDNTDEFTFENLQFTNGNPTRIADKMEEDFNWQDHIPAARLNNEYRISPFAHRFFTNPDSDSLIQYYTSDCGLRLFKGKTYGPNRTFINYSFTTKAIWQWLMDCTDIMYPREAVSVAALFFKCGLIIPIFDPSHGSKFSIRRSRHYTFSRRGWDVCQWRIDDMGMDSASLSFQNGSTENRRRRRESIFSDTSTTRKSSLNDYSPSVDSGKTAVPSEGRFTAFDDILKDPGMRYLFRRHLENEFCAENLDAYLEIKKFLKKAIILEKFISTRKYGGTHRGGKGRVSDIKAVVDSALAKQANECLEIGYHLYASYISVGSPYQLNIDHALRESISMIMLKPKVPLPKKISFKINDEEFAPAKEANFGILTNSLQKPKPALLRENLSKKKAGWATRQVKRETSPIESANTDSHDTKTQEDETLVTAIDTIKKLFHLFETLNQSLYRLMKVDSLQKFLSSEEYQEAVNLADI